MEAKYQVWEKDWSSFVGIIDTDKTVDLMIMDTSVRVPMKAKVKIHTKQVDKSEPIEILGNWSQPHGLGQYFTEVLEVYEEEE